MKRFAYLGTAFAAAILLAVPFVGGDEPAVSSASAATPTTSVSASSFAVTITHSTAVVSSAVAVTEHVAQKPVPKPVVRVAVKAPVRASSAARPSVSRTATAHKAVSAPGDGGCPANVGGATRSAPSKVSAGGVHGTTSSDISSFAHTFNAIRVSHCIPPIPLANFRYDSCMEAHLFWIAEDPSTDPMSAWGHIPTVRSDGKPSVGCDGNLAGGSGNTGATVATKWWNSLAHRASLYRPATGGSMAHVCIVFAMTHGGIPNEPYSFTRAAARWVGC